VSKGLRALNKVVDRLLAYRPDRSSGKAKKESKASVKNQKGGS